MMGTCIDRGKTRSGSDTEEGFLDGTSLAELGSEMDTMRRLLGVMVPEMHTGGAVAQVTASCSENSSQRSLSPPVS